MNKYQYKVQGVDYDVEIENVEGNIAKVNVNGISFEVELKQPINAKPISRPHVKPAAAPAAAAPVAAPAQQAPAKAAGSGTKVPAPLPGTITEVKVKEGDTVKAGDTVVVLEAMKMTNSLEAEKDGKVTAICVKQGESVMGDSPLVVIE